MACSLLLSIYLISTFPNIYTLTFLYLIPIICFLACIIFSNILTTSTPIPFYLTPIFSSLLYPYVPLFCPHVPLHHPQFSISLHCHIQCYIFSPILIPSTLVFPLPPFSHV